MFEGLNRIQERLSWSDKLYINEKRLRYLVERFGDDIQDTIPDRREGQVAVCFYNLYDPLEARKYLYPFKWWDHEILLIKSWMKAGVFDITELYLESYLKEEDSVDSPKYISTSYASTHDLIWIAEKLGRFDLAQQLYTLLNEYGEDIDDNIALLMNYGHVLLMNGDIDESMRYYQKCQDVGITADWPQNEIKRQHQSIKTVIANDFALFSWLNVGNESLQHQAAERLGLSYRKDFLTSPSDSTFTETMHQQLVGTWALRDSSVVISINETLPFCVYKVFDNNKQEVLRLLTNCRFSNRDGHMYWEELNQDNDNISSGEITDINERSFSVRIIENGIKADINKIRTYFKVIED